MLKLLSAFFGTGVGAKLGSTIADGAKIVALLPIIVYMCDKVIPRAITHLSDEAFTVTWGQLGFMGLVGWFVIQLVHWTPPVKKDE